MKSTNLECIDKAEILKLYIEKFSVLDLYDVERTNGNKFSKKECVKVISLKRTKLNINTGHSNSQLYSGQ